METVLALDIGGTKIAGGIIDSYGRILLTAKVSTPIKVGGAAIFEKATILLRSLQDRFDGPPPKAIGISTGGQIDSRGLIIGGTGMIPNWVEYPLRIQIIQQIGLPTVVLNDGHAAALAESRFGAGKDRASMLCVVIGTGLGGGLVVEGRVQRGYQGLAGSVGQMKLWAKGQYVPLESLVSGPGLMRLYNGRQLHNPVTSGHEVAQRLNKNDSIAQDVVVEMAEWLGLGLSHALHACDAECVVVGGSVAQLGDLLIDAAQHSLKRHGHATIGETPIIPAALGPQAGLVGAAIYGHFYVNGNISPT